MSLKEYLHSLNIVVENDEDVSSFFNNPSIKSSLLEAWNTLHLKEEKPDDNVQKLELDEIIIESEDEEENASEILLNDLEKEEQKSEVMGNILGDNQPLNAQMQEDAQELAFRNRIEGLPFRLQNGKVNKEYIFTLDPEMVYNSEIKICRFGNLESIGLHFDADTKTFKGTPNVAGDHKIEMYYRHRDWGEDKPELMRELPIFINPDPQSLWNNIPTPTDIRYYKEDHDSEFIDKAANKKILAGSQRGRSHAHEGKARDDHFTINFDEENAWYTLVVADGAGSAKYSRKGAEVACNTVVEVCKSQLNQYAEQLENLIKEHTSEESDSSRKKLGDTIYNILGSAIFKANKEIEKTALEAKCQINDFATTLLASICKQTPNGWFIASFWVGDGALAVYNKETQYLRVMGESDGGEFAGQTCFLTMPQIIQPEEMYKRLRFEIVEDFTALILMTDGITDPKFETDANLLRIEKWDRLWTEITSEVDCEADGDTMQAQLLDWLNFWSPGNHDDRTIAMLY